MASYRAIASLVEHDALNEVAWRKTGEMQYNLRLFVVDHDPNANITSLAGVDWQKQVGPIRNHPASMKLETL